MRNGTKLKEILRHHTIDVSMDNGHFRICVFSRKDLIPDGDLEQQTVTGKSWSEAIGKAHRLAQKNEVKDE